MKYILSIVALVCLGFVAGCGSSVSQAGPAPTQSGDLARLESTPAASSPTPVVGPTPTGTPTLVLATPANSGTEPPVTVAPVIAPASAEPGPATPAGETSAGYGLQVYQAQYCGLCHQLDAAQTKGLFGPTHNHIASIAEGRVHDPNYTGAARTAAEYIRESILDPQAYVVAGYEQTQHHMPAYAHLSQTDVEALVQMLIEQK